MGIAAILVVCRPDVEFVRANIRTLTDLSIPVVLYDNTPGGDHLQVRRELTSHAAASSVTYLGTGTNVGLSVAYNRCVRSFLEDDAIDAFLILDDDTVVEPRSVTSLVASYEYACARGRLAVIGGKPVRSDGAPYRYELASRRKVFGRFADAALVISSFSIVSKSCLQSIGYFHEDFFLDHIDYDFCWRARKAGYLTLIDEEIPFTHRIGIGDVRILGLRLCAISQPHRGYYQVRNTILSAKRSGAPLSWLVPKVMKRFIVVVLNGIVQNDLLHRLRCAVKGLVHGISGRSGRLPV